MCGLKNVAPSCKKCENSVSKYLKNNKYISNLVYIKCSKFPKYFNQRCYVKSFCKNSKSSDVAAVSYCWFVRAVREKCKHRSRHALDGLLSRRLLLNANVTNRVCLPCLRTVLETCSLHALCEEGSALLTSRSRSPLAVAFEPCLAARGIVQLGILKLRKCDCC